MNVKSILYYLAHPKKAWYINKKDSKEAYTIISHYCIFIKGYISIQNKRNKILPDKNKSKYFRHKERS